MTRPGDWSARKLHYQFRDPLLLEQALTHRSAGGAHNERLEFLGDAVLGTVIAHALYDRCPEAREGVLSRHRARLVRRETLATLAAELDLGAQLTLGGGERRSGGHQRKSVLADALEAVLGAVMLDGGYAAARGVVLALYAPRLAALPPESELIDAKTALQELLQSRGLPPPEYALTNATGVAHAQTFTVSCSIRPLDIETAGVGGSRRKAEQQAAARALELVSANE